MSKQMVDISVCISTYNSAETLKACLDSVFRQTVNPREVIVCDGGSSDATLEILKKYPVKIVSTNVRGVGLARDILTSAASGKIIAWIDSDVVIPINWLELRKKIHEEHPKIECLSNALPVMSMTEAIERSKTPISSEIDLEPRDITIQAALTINREIVRQVGGYDPLFEWGEDWDLRIRLVREGVGLYWTEKCLSYHIRSEKYVKWTRKLIFHHDLEPRKFILAGNFTCFLSKYGIWYIKTNPRHFLTFLLRMWILYSLLGIVIHPRFGFISFIAAVVTNLVASKIHHKILRVGFLIEQTLKAVGEHRNLLRSIHYLSTSSKR